MIKRADPHIRISPQEGPQTKFSRSKADIAIYGGAAGGGKSYALLLEPLRHVAIRGFNCVIFRRTSEQVRMAGGLWDESSNLYPLVGGKGRENTLDWTWGQRRSSVRFEQLQHENTKHEYMGAQLCLIEFDELTHFTESQFWYVVSRNRSVCGIKPYCRASTNPDAGSWVARLVAWWINQDTGYAIPERSGVIRYLFKDDEDLFWGDSVEEVLSQCPKADPRFVKSFTFVPAKLADNRILTEKDPAYEASLLSLPRVERERLLGGNWKVAQDSVIKPSDLVTYARSGDNYKIGTVNPIIIHPAQCRRFATIDTAGSSKEKAEDKKGKPPSWSVLCVWDYHAQSDRLFLHHVWRDRVGWIDLKRAAADTLKEHRCSKVYIENAHHGPALREELKGVRVEMIGPVIEGMTESHRGAKLERAIASGLLSRVEDHRLFIPDDGRAWIAAFKGELTAWGGLPDETADQIDNCSYASYVVRRLVSSWGGTIKAGGLTRR